MALAKGPMRAMKATWPDIIEAKGNLKYESVTQAIRMLGDGLGPSSSSKFRVNPKVRVNPKDTAARPMRSITYRKMMMIFHTVMNLVLPLQPMHPMHLKL